MERKQLVEELIKSLTQHPDQWVFTELTARNDYSGIHIFIPGSYISHPTKQKFGIVDRWKIAKAVSECKKVFLMNLMKKSNR